MNIYNKDNKIYFSCLYSTVCFPTCEYTHEKSSKLQAVNIIKFIRLKQDLRIPSYVTIKNKACNERHNSLLRGKVETAACVR